MKPVLNARMVLVFVLCSAWGLWAVPMSEWVKCHLGVFWVMTGSFLPAGPGGKAKCSSLGRAEEKCVKALRCHQMSLEAVLHQGIRSVHLTANVLMQLGLSYVLQSELNELSEWRLWAKTRLQLISGIFFFLFSFLVQLLFSPGCHWTKLCCLRKTCKPRRL